MRRKLNEEWTGTVVGKMHQYGITNAELGQACGYTEQYVSMLLNGRKEFKNLKSKERTKSHVMTSLDRIIEEAIK